MISLLMCTHLLFSCYVACNTNVSVVCEIKSTYLLTYLPPIYGSKRFPPQIVLMLGKGIQPRTGGPNLNVNVKVKVNLALYSASS